MRLLGSEFIFGGVSLFREIFRFGGVQPNREISRSLRQISGHGISYIERAGVEKLVGEYQRGSDKRCRTALIISFDELLTEFEGEIVIMIEGQLCDEIKRDDLYNQNRLKHLDSGPQSSGYRSLN